MTRAFWLDPDWSGGDNLRDPGTRPFWMRPPLRPAVGGGRHIPLLRRGPPAPSAPWGDAPIPLVYGTTRVRTIATCDGMHGQGTYHKVPGRYVGHGEVRPDHVCGPFVTLWTGYRYCKICEEPAE